MTKFNDAQLKYLESLIVFKADDPMKGFDVRGNVLGNVRGSVGGSVWGNVEGSVWGNVEGSVWGDVWGSVGGKNLAELTGGKDE